MPPVWNFTPTLQNYRDVFAGANFTRYFFNNFIIATTTSDIASETHAALGLRPALYLLLFDQAGVLVGLEGDLGAATALFILHHLTGSACLFTEFWFWDKAENIIIGGHAGPQNPAVAAPGVRPVGAAFFGGRLDMYRLRWW